MTRLLKFLAKEALETVVVLLLIGSLFWALEVGSTLSWSVFGLTLFGLIYCIVRPKKQRDGED